MRHRCLLFKLPLCDALLQRPELRWGLVWGPSALALATLQGPGESVRVQVTASASSGGRDRCCRLRGSHRNVLLSVLEPGGPRSGAPQFGSLVKAPAGLQVGTSHCVPAWRGDSERSFLVSLWSLSHRGAPPSSPHLNPITSQRSPPSTTQG